MSSMQCVFLINTVFFIKLPLLNHQPSTATHFNKTSPSNCFIVCVRTHQFFRPTCLCTVLSTSLYCRAIGVQNFEFGRSQLLVPIPIVFVANPPLWNCRFVFSKHPIWPTIYATQTRYWLASFWYGQQISTCTTMKKQP